MEEVTVGGSPNVEEPIEPEGGIEVLENPEVPDEISPDALESIPSQPLKQRRRNKRKRNNKRLRQQKRRQRECDPDNEDEDIDELDLVPSRIRRHTKLRGPIGPAGPPVILSKHKKVKITGN